MAYPDSGSSRSGPGPSSLPFKPPGGERRWDGPDNRDRGAFRRELSRESPGRSFSPARWDYPPPRAGPPRARTPSPPRRFQERGYDMRDRAVDDQWRGPPLNGRPIGRERDWERDRDWRRNDRFEPRSTPASLGHSPPDRTPRSPPFPPRNGGRFQTRSPPPPVPRIPSGPRTAAPGPALLREDRPNPSRPLENATPGPGPSTVANSTPSSAPRAPRSQRGSSSPVDTLSLRTDDLSPSASSKPVGQSDRSNPEADLEEGEVLSPVKTLIPPWEQREAARAYGRTWDRDRDRPWERDRDRGFDRMREEERDRDRWDQGRNFRSRNSVSPHKRSRSPYQSLPLRRQDDRPSNGHQRARSNSVPPARPYSPETRRMESHDNKEDQDDDAPRIRRPDTPDEPPPEDDIKPTIQQEQDALQVALQDSPKRPLTPLEPPPQTSTSVDVSMGDYKEEQPDTANTAREAADVVPSPDVRTRSPVKPAEPLSLDTPAQDTNAIETELADMPSAPVAVTEDVEMRSPTASDVTKPTEDAPPPLQPASAETEVAQPAVDPSGEGQDVRADLSSRVAPGTPNAPVPEESIYADTSQSPAKQTRESAADLDSMLETKEETTTDTETEVAQNVSNVLPAAQTPSDDTVPDDIEKQVERADPDSSRAIKEQRRAVSTSVATRGDKVKEVRGAAEQAVPGAVAPKATLAERRAVVLPPPNAPISSPFSDRFRRDSRPTGGSFETDNGPRTNEAEEPPSSEAEDDENRSLKLLSAVKAAQSHVIKRDPVESFQTEPVHMVQTSRIDPFLVDTTTRDARIKEYVAPLVKQQAGIEHLVHLVIQTDTASEKKKAEALKLEYQMLDAEWKIHCDRLDALMQERGPPPQDLYAFAQPFPILAPALAGAQPTTPLVDDSSNTRTRRRNIGDAVATEADFEAILADLADSAAKDPTVRANKTAAVVPDMVPAHERRMLYDDDNDLVTDPLVFYDFAGRAEPIWTEEERAIFLRRYLLYPKQFGKIADGLELKTPAECVAYYYRTKKQIDYKGMLASRRGDKKKKPAAKSALLADLDRKKPTINSASTPGPRSAITPARKGEDGAPRRGRQAKDSGASTPVVEGIPRRRRLDEDDGVESSANPSRAGSETPSFAKARMRMAIKGPKRPRVSSVTETVPAPPPPPVDAVEPDVEATMPSQAPPATTASGPVDLLPPVKRAIKRRKVDPNDPNAPIDEKEKDQSKPSRRAATNSYWSVEEKKRFRELVVQFGNDPKLIAAELKGKSERQVSNFYDAHREDMKLEELAKGGESAAAELQKQNGPAETLSRASPFMSVPQGPGQYARSIYDVQPGQRRSDAFEPRFAEPRLGMFPPSPRQPSGAADVKPVSRPGGPKYVLEAL